MRRIFLSYLLFSSLIRTFTVGNGITPFRLLLQFADCHCWSGIPPCPEDIWEVLFTDRIPQADYRRSRRLLRERPSNKRPRKLG